MGRAPVKLLAVDLDGTLLTDDKKLSRENKEALEACLARGIQVVVASGRFLASHRQMTKSLGLGLETGVHIADGGGVIYRGDQVEIIGAMDPAVYRQTLQKLRDCAVQAYVSDGRHVYYDRPGPLDAIYAPMIQTGAVWCTADLSEVKQPLKFIVPCADAHDLHCLTALAPEGTKVFVAAPHIAEITSEALDKWHALEVLMKRAHIAPENVAVLGDSGNDVMMVRNAGLGLAVKNALPQVRAAADAVSKDDNNHSGAAELINRYVLGLSETKTS